MNILKAKIPLYDCCKWPSEAQSTSPVCLQTKPTVRCRKRNVHPHPPTVSNYRSILFGLLVCFMSRSKCFAFMISEAEPLRFGPRMFPRTKSSRCLRLNSQRINGAHRSNGQEHDHTNNHRNNNNNSDGLFHMAKNNNDIPNNYYHDIPKHVAFVCDGNSRWAKARNLPTVFGHAEGAKRLVEMTASLKQYGVSYCTMYGFSTENWRRSPSEINDILTVMEQTARRFYGQALNERVRVKILGDIHDQRIPTSLREILQQLELDTSVFGEEEATTTTTMTTSLTICLAVNYGGRQDIVNASVRLAQAIASGELSPTDVTEDTFASYMYTHDIPDPDLIIRTSGECRVSNFLLWNAAYSELYFTPVLWPDFGEDHWKTAVEWYRDRKRRFGGRADSYSPSPSTKSTTSKSASPRRISVAEP
jgi:undecaprenyl diphosphate synthase